MKNEDQLKGKAENLKGRAKEVVGVVTGNKRMQVKGVIERAKGAIQEKVGDVKRTMSREPTKSDDE
jgi:uncharacterized protein YjbJ (UPF0337 family)